MSDSVDGAPLKHTRNHKDCPACEEANRLVERKKSMSTMLLRDAGELWLTQKSWKRRKPKTIECCRSYLKALLGFFGDMCLDEFTPGSILAYQTDRLKVVGPSAINHELNALAQILRQAGLWGKLKDYYGPLPEPEWQKPKVFTFEEQQRIFDFAKDDPELELAELVFTITRNTSASGTELRLAHIRNLNLSTPPYTFQVTADTTKNAIRPRLIPLNEDAEDAFRRALRRANTLGAHRQDQFLFPFRVGRGHYDPSRPASKSWLRHQTKVLRDRTGIEHLSPHAWRHQLCTEMLEQGVPRDNVVAVMGWVSEKMVETYSHTRLEAKRDAISAAQRKPPQGVQHTYLHRACPGCALSKKIIQFPS
jgi:integrase